MCIIFFLTENFPSMDFHEMGSSSPSRGEKLPQETRQAHTVKSVHK